MGCHGLLIATFVCMQLFSCLNCGQVLYFENTRCGHCGNVVGLMESGNDLMALSAGGGEPFKAVSLAQYYYCANHAFDVCNWLVPEGNNAFCRACELNRIIPDLQQPMYREYWMRLEVAKHRLVYSLLRLRLPLENKLRQPEKGLSFDFVADEKDKKVFTGHDNGIITINIAEADDIQREMIRQHMHEPYRTLLGHFRHEVGHYYWDVLIRDGGRLAEFRQVFGDERVDYGQALEQHYTEGAPADWTEYYISAYASSHPWEDWAETWAHYLHIMDTFETAWSYDMRVQPRLAPTGGLSGTGTFDPYAEPQFDRIIQNWLPLTYAMNSFNRSMGVDDLYPFVIPPEVMGKLNFIHQILQTIG